MKLAIIERSINYIGRPDTPPLPGRLLWSMVDYHRRVAVYVVEHELGNEVPRITEWCHKENGEVVCDLTVE